PASPITSTQVVYVYAQTGTTPNCFSEASFTVTITDSPVVDVVDDATACDCYISPSLTVGNYFDASGGNGTQYFAGDSICSSMTMYVYGETGTTPNCTDESSFTITINPTPTTPIVQDIVACDEYILPALPAGSTYHSLPGGVGPAPVSPITSSQLVYVYAQTGTSPNCSAEASFTVTINETPVVDNPVDVTACDCYELPALLVGNYYDAPGGGGAMYNAGQNVCSSMTMYIYAETGTTPYCFAESSFTIPINQTPDVPVVQDVTACDSFVLPALPAGSTYHSQPGGVGPAPASPITSTQLV